MVDLFISGGTTIRPMNIPEAMRICSSLYNRLQSWKWRLLGRKYSVHHQSKVDYHSTTHTPWRNFKDVSVSIPIMLLLRTTDIHRLWPRTTTTGEERKTPAKGSRSTREKTSPMVMMMRRERKMKHLASLPKTSCGITCFLLELGLETTHFISLFSPWLFQIYRGGSQDECF